MNQKTAVIASGVVAIALLTGCSVSETYEYEVSGTVKHQQVDYDCPGEDIAMAPMSFVARTGGGTGRSSSRSGGSKKSNDSRSNDERPSNSNRSSSSNTSGGSTGGGSNSRPSAKKASTPKNKGIKLGKKPDAPQKTKKISKPPLRKGKGCTNEYEIFVIDKKGNLYEQDVREADYSKCLTAKVPSGQKAKLFPLCTKG